MSVPTGGPITYWQADARLDGYVTGYHRYAAAVPPGLVLRDAFFPSIATIRVALHGSPDWSVRLNHRMFDPVPRAAFFGPSSHAGYLESRGGTLVGVGLLPAGWARLFGGDVSRYANRIVALRQVDAGWSQLGEQLERDIDPREVFDAWLLARLERHAEVDPRVAEIQALLDDPAVTRIETIAERLHLPPRALAALTRFNFGFTPKLLLRRTRFLRALSMILAGGNDSTTRLAEAGYWDRSHFLRDCHSFLGCSVREFNKRRGLMNDLAMRERARVLGAPV